MLVPATDKTPVLVRVKALPKLTLPPPDSPVPEVIVTEEFAKLALVIPAVPERLLLVIFVIVLSVALIVLPVSVCA